jgi:hypothetical protein
MENLRQFFSIFEVQFKKKLHSGKSGGSESKEPSKIFNFNKKMKKRSSVMFAGVHDQDQSSQKLVKCDRRQSVVD